MREVYTQPNLNGYSVGGRVIKGDIAPHLDFGLDDDIDTNPKPNPISDIEQIFDKSNGFVPVGSLYKFRYEG